MNTVCDFMNTVTDIVKKHEEIFEGVGKLKDFQLQLHVNDNIKPVAQLARRIPYAMRKKVEAKIAELEKFDIIEKVEGATSWVSPIVVVPKSSGDIRMCVDMRIANTAIERERHPIPTVDEVLTELNGATVFSKIDLKLTAKCGRFSLTGGMANEYRTNRLLSGDGFLTAMRISQMRSTIPW